MQFTTDKNKEIVVRFNKEVVEQGKMESFNELVASNVINHAAPDGAPHGPDSMVHFIFHVLKAGFHNISVEILDQVAEGDKVTTRKAIHATHTGYFMGIPPSHKKVIINVIDIIRLHDGKYLEHWGMSNLSDVIREIS